MSRQRSANAAFIAALALAGCGGGNVSVEPVFAGDVPVTSADFLAKTFPFHYIARNRTTNDLERKTGTVSILSFEQFKISTDDVTEIITETSEGNYAGGTLNAESFFFLPGIGAINAQDENKTYASLFGFETPTSQMPSDAAITYAGPTAARLFASGPLVELPDYADLPDMVGDTDLSVDFDTGTVTGSLFSSDSARVDIRDGAVSENGISGDVEFF